MDINKKIDNMPFLFEWVKYKGKVYFAEVDIIKSQEEGLIKVNLCYCATKALNNIVEKTVLYRAKDFSIYDNIPSLQQTTGQLARATKAIQG